MQAFLDALIGFNDKLNGIVWGVPALTLLAVLIALTLLTLALTAMSPAVIAVSADLAALLVFLDVVLPCSLLGCCGCTGGIVSHVCLQIFFLFP